MDKEDINKKFKSLNEEQKHDYLNQFNKSKKNIIKVFSILIIISIIALPIAIVNCLINNLNEDIAVVVVAFIFYLVLCSAILFISVKNLKWEDEKKIKKQIEIIENKNNRKSKNHVDISKVKSVIILDSYTELSDKLHAVLNYQEIIQTRYYKFRVNYFDGSFKIITAKEDSPNYNALIGFVGNEITENNTSKPAEDNTELIKKYKQLLDDGVITQEEFEKKKKELL